jgi:class 3 adenylate cyclase
MSLEGLGGHTPDIRASDAEREYVVDVLRAHCSEGRIDLDEFSERINRVYAARTIGELTEITADLPVPASQAGPAATREPGRTRRAVKWTIGFMSGPNRRGRWRIEGSTTAVAFMGGVGLDLRDAEIAGDEITIRCFAMMGGVEIIVPEGIEVHISGIPFMGGCDDKTNPDIPILPGSPVVRIHYFAMMGGIGVKSKASPEEERKRKEQRKKGRDARREAFRDAHDARHDARRDVHEAIQQAKLEAIQQAREATKRALAAIPDWLGEQAGATPTQPRQPNQPPQPASGNTNPAPEGTVTLLITDIEGSTSMTEEMGDIRWMRVLNRHNDQVRQCVADHGGIELKQQGDGFLLAFPSARKALLCAVSLQKSFHEDDMPVRMGLHTGEVIREGDDLYGRNVILASRICGEARGGEILVSSLTKELTDSSGDLDFSDSREVELKGLNGTFRVWSLAWK